jgi:signal transduction histidine kinase
MVAVPLLAHGKLLGAIALVSSDRAYGSRDVRLAEELSHRAALSMENARLYESARRATRARDEVLGVVAHDLRNPLNAIALSAKALARETAGTVRDELLGIERPVRRMNRLIRDLLDVTRIEAGRLPLHFDTFSVGPLVADAVAAQTALAASASVTLRVELPATLRDLRGDRDRLLQVFENLLGNAMAYTPPGGRITVGAAENEKEIVFCVADTGKGIATKDIPHLFDRFWQVRAGEGHGAGLGLSIAKGITEAHGGRIWVESVPGNGSRFFFSIPG